MSFPELLIQIPAPVIDESYYAGGKVEMTVLQAAKLSEEYCHQVSQYVRDNANKLDLEKDIIPAVEFAMRLFNAENFTGALSIKERNEFAVIYKRFGESELLEKRVGAGNTGNLTKEELEALEARGIVEDLKMCCYQRLLSRDGEMPVATVRFSGLLLCAVALVSVELSPEAVDTVIVDPVNEKEPLFPLQNIWRLRVLFRHQLSLQHRAHSIFLHMSSCVDALATLPEGERTTEILLEIGHVQRYFHRRDLAAASFRSAAECSGLQLEETSIMGVRTRWQQHQLVQMILNATSSREVPADSTTEEQPKVELSEKDGHDLLDRPRETPDSPPLPVTPLHPEDKAILLAMCVDIMNENPYNGLTKHHMMTYVERLLVDPAPSPFAIASQTLLTRSRLEAGRNKVQERAFTQMTTLLEQFSLTEKEADRSTFARSKSDYFYSVPYPSIWELRSEFAAVCFEETLFKTALDMYEQNLDWEKIIECCKKLDKRRRAESLARDLLERDPTNPTLWVALGEATRDDKHLWKAWELSGHTAAAPMRVLARFALEREHYDKVVEYFDISVKLNPLFGGDWFSLGYAALRMKNLQRSGEAFTRVCQIDPTDSYAWNNLSSILLREGKLRPAYNCMSQALRNNRRNWQMWQNYFQIGCELNEVFESTNALQVALEIAKRSIKLERTGMERFVRMTIAYLKGEIPGSSAESTGAETNTGVYASLSKLPTADDIGHLPLSNARGEEGDAENEEGEEELAMDLQPFGGDVELPEDMFRRGGDGSDSHPVGASEAARAGILQRHTQRVRELFGRILDNFVTDPDLYRCAAVLFEYLDGPLAAYRYCVKEFRACQQKDQWERDDTKFMRTVECLEDTLGCAERAVKEQSDKMESNEPMKEEDQKEILEALTQLNNNIKSVLAASEEHMEKTEGYAHLRALAKESKAALQEAKATFILN